MKPCPNCGTPISGNKENCKFCQERVAMRTIPLALDQPNASHFLAKFPSKEFEELYRADGLLIATRQGDAVHYGEVIQEHQTRRFATFSAASAFLRNIANLDNMAVAAGRWHEFATLVRNYASWPADWEKPTDVAPVLIEERIVEGKIIVPGTAIDSTSRLLRQ